MRPRFVPILIAAGILLAGCSSPSGLANQDGSVPLVTASMDTKQEFEWTKELLFEAMLDPNLVESWGYKAGSDGKSAVDDFETDDQNLFMDDEILVKPSDCELVSKMILSGDKIGAKYFSLLWHSDLKEDLDFKSFWNFVYAFESKEYAEQTFAQLVTDQEQCGSFSLVADGDVLSWKIWDAPTVKQSDLLIGFDGEGKATAFGLNGSAIWVLNVTNADSSSSSQDVAIAAAEFINSNLTAIQEK